MSRLIILMYHMVADPASGAEARFACSPTRFRDHMRFLRKAGYQLVHLANVDGYLKGEAQIPDKAVVVTFDDGFRDNYENALPILQEFDVPATLFLVSGVVGKTNQWMNSGAYAQRPMLSWDQVREMDIAGIEIGGHTVTHPRLPELSAEQLRAEVAGGKAAIEDQLGHGLASFAYPFGLFNEQVEAAVVEAGYRVACSTRSGFNRPTTDRYLLRRIEVQGTDPVWKLRQKMQFGSNEAGLFQPLRYYYGRVRARLPWVQKP